DRGATLAAVRQAIQRVGGEAGPNDMFVLFYSGHGGRETRQTFQPADPDGLDETLVFYDAELTDDAVNELLGGVHARVTPVALDGGYSGGFRQDVIQASARTSALGS